MGGNERERYVCVVIGWLIVAIFAIMCAGCRQTMYVPVETVRTDTCYVNKVRTDSVLVRDSVVIDRAGDTVKVTAWRWRERYVFQRDTIYRCRVDSVAVPYPVERQSTRWQKAKQSIGGFALCLVAVVVIAAVVWLAIRKMRK